MNRDAALSKYFADAASWDADRVAQQQRATRIAWIVAWGGWLCAMTIAVALMLLMPLKRVEPFVVRVDNHTGVVDVVPVYSEKATLPEAVTRYFLDHYVMTCERFNYATAESDYEECGAFHTAARNQRWSTQWARSNPNSPLNLYKDGSTLRAQVSSISFFTRGSGVADLAQVRYTQQRRAAGGTEDQVTHWIATVQYTYVDPSKEPKTRRWNPLGFKIIEFQAEPEVLGEGSTVAMNTGSAP
ncbi:MAG: virB8 family protein [Steroidobacteraceae bacterium]